MKNDQELFHELSGSFIKLVLVAFSIAAPVSWIVVREWLDSFAYRVDLGAAVFVAAGVAVMAIALLTVSYQAVKAARVNPARSIAISD